MSNYILWPGDIDIPKRVLHLVPREEAYIHSMGKKCTCKCVPILESYYNGKICLVIHNPVSELNTPVSYEDIKKFKKLYLLTEKNRSYLIKWTNK